MSRLDVRSREYKVMLKPDAFAGDEEKIREVAASFWSEASENVASDRDMGAAGRGNAETKFEEDVKPPFISVFSYSTTVEVDDDVDVSRLREVMDLFPGLADELDDAGDHELTDVGSFWARELVLVGAVLQLGRRDVEAECALVVWHDDAGAVGEKPACVEFSFKYGDDQEDYRGSVARDAHDVLQALGQLPWVHPKPTTKTALVYR